MARNRCITLCSKMKLMILILKQLWATHYLELLHQICLRLWSFIFPLKFHLLSSYLVIQHTILGQRQDASFTHLIFINVAQTKVGCRSLSKRAVRLEQRTFGIVLVSLLLTLKRFHAMLRCFHLKKKIPFRRSTNETLKSSHYYKVSFVALMNMGEGNQLPLHYSSWRF